MDETKIKSILIKFYTGNDMRTSTELTRKIGEQALKDCRDNKLLELEDNQGVWVYRITEKGKQYRDS